MAPIGVTERITVREQAPLLDECDCRRLADSYDRYVSIWTTIGDRHGATAPCGWQSTTERDLPSVDHRGQLSRRGRQVPQRNWQSIGHQYTTCFADPRDQIPGNAPRYFSVIRSDGIHNINPSFNKQFAVHEGMTLMFRVDFFNFTNTPRFGFPDLAYGSETFGTVSSTTNGNIPRHTQFGLRFQF
jgi:hypothetical protein